MPILLDFVKEAFENLPGEQRILKALCLGAFFFSECLLIHPFSDGNGRVSRLSLSILLKDYIFVPISLNYNDDKYIYLESLEKRDQGIKIPWSVIEYIIHCTLDTLEKML